MKRVDPKVYTEKYYLTDCTGHKEFKESLGEQLEIRFKEIVKHFNVSYGMRILDIGCGRGEMILFCAKKGATAIGIDYAEDAIRLAKLVRSRQIDRIKQRMNFYTMDAKKLKFQDSFFDLIILTDVVEHLYPEELKLVFKEIKRILKNGGKIVIHTAPNRWFNDFGYKYYSYPISTALVFIWNSLFKKNYPNIAKPEELRTDSHAIMHVNEPRYFSLRKLYKKYGFHGTIDSTNITAKKPPLSFQDILFNFIVFLDPISRKFPLNIIFGSDFFSILINKK